MGEFEFWIRVAGTGGIVYIPELFSFFGRHSASNTATAKIYDHLVLTRTKAMAQLFEENPILKNSTVSVEQAIVGNFIWGAKSVHGIEGESPRFKEYLRAALEVLPSSQQLWQLINECSDLEFRGEMENLRLRKETSASPE